MPIDGSYLSVQSKNELTLYCHNIGGLVTAPPRAMAAPPISRGTLIVPLADRPDVFQQTILTKVPPENGHTAGQHGHRI